MKTDPAMRAFRTPKVGVLLYELADVINKMIKTGYCASGLRQPSIIDPFVPTVYDASK